MTNQMIRLLFFFMLASVSGISQELTVKSRGRVFDEQGNKMTSASVRETLKDNPEALFMYNSGREKKTWGNILIASGITLAATNLAVGLYGDTTRINSDGVVETRKVRPTLAIIGGAMIVAAIPIKIGYTRKIKAAIDTYNQMPAKASTEVSLVADPNGFGIQVVF